MKEKFLFFPLWLLNRVIHKWFSAAHPWERMVHSGTPGSSIHPLFLSQLSPSADLAVAVFLTFTGKQKDAIIIKPIRLIFGKRTRIRSTDSQTG